jgi:hypothetical protein
MEIELILSTILLATHYAIRFSEALQNALQLVTICRQSTSIWPA